MPRSFKETQLQRIRELCIFRTQKLILEMRDASSLDTGHGTSPPTIYLSEGSVLGDHGMISGPFHSHWRVSADSAEPMGDVPPPSLERSGMYYLAGSASFLIHATEPLIWFGYQVGPRYGCGCRIEVAISLGHKPYFHREAALWRS